VHRLEVNKLRNAAKFFAHLLHTNAIEWSCLQAIRITEDDTTASSRIFIKIVFQELAENLGIEKLAQKLREEPLLPYLEGIFPKDSVDNARFSINFFTSIGLGRVTEDLREFIKSAPKLLLERKYAELLAQANASSSSDDSSSDSDSDSDSSSESESESEDEKHRKSKRR
jgi:pre-mRNA-splicing factor CWC22